MWASLALTTLATALLTVPALRRRRPVLLACSALLFTGIWIEKGMGLIVPGFVPEPWGRIFAEYSPTWVEWTVTLGIWALGAWVFTLLTKVAVGVELRYQRSR